jgi:CRISPR/Cas system-associated endonuclease Cas3-HD
MNEKEALAYADRLRKERENNEVDKERALKRLKDAGIFDEHGKVKKYYKKILA